MLRLVIILIGNHLPNDRHGYGLRPRSNHQYQCSEARFNATESQFKVQSSKVQGSRAAVQDAAELRFKVLSPINYESVST